MRPWAVSSEVGRFLFVGVGAVLRMFEGSLEFNVRFRISHRALLQKSRGTDRESGYAQHIAERFCLSVEGLVTQVRGYASVEA